VFTRTQRARLVAACATLFVLLPQARPARATLVQYWPLDDGVGTTASNSVSGGNTGVLTNFDTAKVNNGGTETPPSDWVTTGLSPLLPHSTGALDFEGGTTTGDWVDGGDINLSSTGSGGAATLSMWVRPNALNGDDRLYGQNGTGLPPTVGGAAHVLANGQVEIWDGTAWLNALPAASPRSLAVGAWTQLTLVWNNGSVTTYADGVAENTVVADFDFQGAGHELGIGNRFRSTNGTTFDGVIDEVAVWDRALSLTEITAVGSLAQEPSLTYDVAEADQLLEAFNQSTPLVTIDGVAWLLVDDGSLTGPPGQLAPTVLNGFDTLALNLQGGNGMAIVIVPEPSSFLFIVSVTVGLTRRMRRRH